MKQIIFIVLFIFLFMFCPVNVKALSFSDGFLFAVNNNQSNSGLISNYDQEQTCTGKDSILGDPNVDTSVAWLLDKILTYVTIVGIILIVVLSSIDFLSVVANGNDEAMAKAAKKLALRLLFGALLFFVPTLTNAMLDIFGLTSDSTCGIHQ